jgi:hypothetical protein
MSDNKAKSEPTFGQWRNDGPWGPAIICVERQDGLLRIARCEMPFVGSEHPVNIANAELIVKAVNSYEALTAENVSLKALLKEAHDGLGKFGGYVMAARQKDNTCDYWNGLREEIAAVQELHNKLAAALNGTPQPSQDQSWQEEAVALRREIVDANKARLDGSLREQALESALKEAFGFFTKDAVNVPEVMAPMLNDLGRWIVKTRALIGVEK